MRVFRDINEYGLGPCVLAIGKFNGVHIGHQALLGEVVRLAREAGVQAVALTFDKHPRVLLSKQVNREQRRRRKTQEPGEYDAPYPPQPQSLELVEEGEKIRRIRALGIDALIITKFTQELSNTPANLYLETLCQVLRPCAIVCGEDFRFGKGAAGDVALLRENADRLGYSLVVLPAIKLEGEVVSSTRVIRALYDAKLDKALAMLNVTPDVEPEKDRIETAYHLKQKQT